MQKDSRSEELSPFLVSAYTLNDWNLFSCLPDRYFRCFDGARKLWLYPRVQTAGTRCLKRDYFFVTRDM